MTDWQDNVAELRRNRTPAVLVKVDSIVGSTPREPVQMTFLPPHQTKSKNHVDGHPPPPTGGEPSPLIFHPSLQS